MQQQLVQAPPSLSWCCYHHPISLCLCCCCYHHCWLLLLFEVSYFAVMVTAFDDWPVANWSQFHYCLLSPPVDCCLLFEFAVAVACHLSCAVADAASILLLFAITAGWLLHSIDHAVTAPLLMLLAITANWLLQFSFIFVASSLTAQCTVMPMLMSSPLIFLLV